MRTDSTSEQSPSVWFCNRYSAGKREGPGRKGKSSLDSQGPRVGRDSTPPLHNPRTACDVHLPERNKAPPPPPPVLLRADSHQSTQQSELNEWELRKGSVKKRQMLPWGQAARGPSVSRPPSPPLASPLLLPQPPTPPAGAQAGAASV